MEGFEYRNLEKCPDGFEKLVEQYLSGEVAKDEYSWIEDHIEECPYCSVVFEDAKEVLGYTRFRFSRTPDAFREFKSFHAAQSMIHISTGDPRSITGYVRHVLKCVLAILFFFIPVLKNQRD